MLKDVEIKEEIDIKITEQVRDLLIFSSKNIENEIDEEVLLQVNY